LATDGDGQNRCGRAFGGTFRNGHLSHGDNRYPRVLLPGPPHLLRLQTHKIQSFIAATTIGYGDFHPTRKRSKILAIAIGFVGIVFTGILVAIALHAATHAFQETHDVKKLIEQVDE